MGWLKERCRYLTDSASYRRNRLDRRSLGLDSIAALESPIESRETQLSVECEDLSRRWRARVR